MLRRLFPVLVFLAPGTLWAITVNPDGSLSSGRGDQFYKNRPETVSDALLNEQVGEFWKDRLISRVATDVRVPGPILDVLFSPEILGNPDTRLLVFKVITRDKQDLVFRLLTRPSTVVEYAKFLETETGKMGAIFPGVNEGLSDMLNRVGSAPAIPPELQEELVAILKRLRVTTHNKDTAELCQNIVNQLKPEPAEEPAPIPTVTESPAIALTDEDEDILRAAIETASPDLLEKIAGKIDRAPHLEINTLTALVNAGLRLKEFEPLRTRIRHLVASKVMPMLAYDAADREQLCGLMVLALSL